MPHVVRGTMGVSQKLADARIRNVIKGVTLEEPMSTPLFVITEKLSSAGKSIPLTSRGWKPEWFTKARFPRTVTVGATAPTTGTSIIATDVAHVQPGHILETQRENILVTAVNTTTLELTVIRNTPARTGGPIVSIPAGAVLRVTSTAAEQGAPKGPRFSLNATLDNNLTQIFRRGTGATRTEIQSAQYDTENDFQEGVRDAVITIREEWERAALMHWAKQQITQGSAGATNHNRNIMGGLPAFITDNYINAGGSMTDMDLNIWANRAIRIGGNKRRLLMGGQNVAAIISQFPKEAVRTTVQSKFWGSDIRTLGGSGGWNGEFIMNFQLEDSFWGGVLFVLDMEFIDQFKLQAMDIDLNTADPGTDASEAEVLMEGCIIVRNKKAHLIVHAIEF